MADTKISALTTLAQADVDSSADLLAIVDNSASETKKATPAAIVAAAIDDATAKTTPVDADTMPLTDSAASNAMKKVTWANIKATLKTYFDSLYQAAGTYLTSANITATITNGVTDKAPSEDAVFDALALKVDKASVPVVIQVACSDLTTALTTGTGKAYFRAPYAFTLTGVRASLGTAQTSGSIFTVDVNEAGTSVLSTKLTIDNTEKTSTTAATAAVISDSAIADDAEITVDIDQVGDGTAKGLIVTLIGTRSV